MNTVQSLSKLARVVVTNAFLFGMLYNTGPSFAVEVISPEEALISTPTITLEEAQQNTLSSTSPELQPTTQTSLFESNQWLPWSTSLGGVTDPSSPMEVSTTTGRSFYISKTGTNTGNGSQSNPWASIRYAVSQLQAGDTLYLAEGVYEESADFSTSGRSDAYITIQGIGNVVIDGAKMSSYDSAFDTKGHDYLRFKNLTVNNARSGVEVNIGSNAIEIDGLRTDGNRFGVIINGATNVSVKNAYAINSKNAFRAYGGSRNLTFENIQTYGSKDIYEGMNLNYRNGDGFIFEADVSNVTMRNIISGDHWDAGFDIKASNVLMENVIAFGNKNNFKTWGNNITIRSSLSYHAKRQPRPDGSTVEGNGITVESGTTKLVNVTLVDNEDHDVKIYALGTLRVENSIVARRYVAGGVLFDNDGGLFTSDHVLWYETGRTRPNFTVSSTDLWGDPQFVSWDAPDYHLKSTSLAIDASNPNTELSRFDLNGKERVVGESSDLGAYEFQGEGTTDPVPPPPPAPTPAPEPASVPEPTTEPEPLPPTEGSALFLGLNDGQTVSGKIFVQPNPEVIPDMGKVTYYLNGKKVGKTKKAPFALGGGKGFDTKKLSNGTYVLVGIFKTALGEQPFSVTFNVQNSR